MAGEACLQSNAYLPWTSDYTQLTLDLKISSFLLYIEQKGKRKVQGVPQSQTAAIPRPKEEEETDKSKQAQTEQTYEKH